MLLKRCGILTMKNGNLSLLSKNLYKKNINFNSDIKVQGQEKWRVFLDAPLYVQVLLGICS